MKTISSKDATIGVYLDGKLLAKLPDPSKSLCDTCRKPGHCCTMFTLNIYERAEGWHAGMQRQLDRYGLSFIKPVAPSVIGLHIQRDNPEGRMNGFFSCTRLGADGRCSDYENRPELCRIYEPGSDSLCVEHARKFKGIPIVKEGR